MTKILIHSAIGLTPKQMWPIAPTHLIWFSAKQQQEKQSMRIQTIGFDITTHSVMRDRTEVLWQKMN